MKFDQPIWLVITLVSIPSLIWVFRRFDRARWIALTKFASEHLLQKLTATVSSRLRFMKRWLLILSIGLGFFSLARPQFGFRWEEAKRKGIDILFAVDTSRSMLAQDVSPDRLTRAKLAVLDLLANLQGDRVGLIAFAGTAFLQCPLTLDEDAFRQSLEALDTNVIPKGGTNIASAIQEAEAAFSLGNTNHKVLVLLTDGEDLEANGIIVAKEVAKQRIRIFTVGVGTTRGELIPVRQESGGVEFLKDEKGLVVKSRLDESTLQQIAEATGGFYEPLGQRSEGLEAVYKRGLEPIPKQELSSYMNKVYLERFQWPLALALFCLVLEMLLGNRRGSSKFRVQSSKWKLFEITKPVLSAVFLIAISDSGFVEASPQYAERAYRQGKFQEAFSQYKLAAEKTPKKPELQFNLGSAAYKTGQFTEAAAAYQKALHTGNIPLQQQVFYSLGNTEYRLGQQTEKTNPKQTVQFWKQALQSYENAIKLKADDADAKFNDEFVKKKLAELEKQQKQQQQQQSKQENSDQKNPQNPSGKDQQDQKDQFEKKPPLEAKKDQKSQPSQSPQNQGSDRKKSDQEKLQPLHTDSNKKQPEPRQLQDEKEPPLLPGQMSKEEAKNLLDSLKGDERKAPLLPATLKNQERSEEAPKRDW